MTHPWNVLWLMADELRTDALGCFGPREPAVTTPAIDAIAADGVLFERSYASSPICVPARAALLTGLSPLRSGVLDNEAYDDPMPLVESFTETVARAGWRTLNFGKEHLPGGAVPWQVDVEDGSSMSSLLQDAVDAGSDIRRVGDLGHVYSAVLPEGIAFAPERITKNVVAALDGEQPFVIRASYLQPHRPAVLPEPWASRYADISFDINADPELAPTELERQFGRINGGGDLSSDELQQALCMYYGAVAWLDDQVGVIMSALEERGLSERTIVIVSTDHGATVGDDGGFGKHTFAPQSHRTPLIIAVPGGPSGQRRSDLVVSEDLAATVLGLVGVAPSHPIDGRDLFRDPAPEAIASAIGYGEGWSRAFPNRNAGGWLDGRGWPQRLCVRTERYRLDGNTRLDGTAISPESPDADLFLADSLADPHERHNLIDDDDVSEVRELLLELFGRARSHLEDAPVPVERRHPDGRFTL